MNNNKIDTYIGFAIKSNQIVYGIDNVLCNKKTKLVIVNGIVGNDTTKKLNKLEKIDIVHYETKLVDANIKILGITNENLCKAIKVLTIGGKN